MGFLVKPIERTARGDLDIYVQKLLQAADHSIFAKSEAEIEVWNVRCGGLLDQPTDCMGFWNAAPQGAVAKPDSRRKGKPALPYFIRCFDISGQDPTVVTITWAIYELSRNPDVLKKLRLEIADMFAILSPVTLC